MIAPKLCYVIVILWLVFRGVKINEGGQLKVYYATTKVLGAPISYQMRRLRKRVALLSVNRIVHGLVLLQRSTLPFMLMLLANDVEINPGPTNSVDFEQCSSTINKSRISVRKSLRCLCWNTRSLFSVHKATDGETITNISSLQDFIYSESIDLVALTETWLSEKHFDHEILPQDYSVYRVDRKFRTGGGLLIATKRSSFTESRQVNFNQTTELEIVCVECTTARKKILVVCCYRPPNSPSKWLQSFKEFLDYIGTAYENIIITGDFNFPKISWTENMVIPTGESERLFVNVLSDHYLSQLVYNATRNTSTLDLIITNIPDNINNIEVIDPNTFTMFSDHNCVLFDFQGELTASQQPKRMVYDYKRANFEEINRCLLNTDFEFTCPNSTSDISENWNLWRDTLLAIADQYIPKKTVKGKKNPPWLTRTIKALIKKKESLRRKFRRTKSTSLQEKYKNLRRESKKLIKESRENFFAFLSNTLPSNPKLFWSFFKTSTKSSRIPQHVSIAAENPDFPRLVAETPNQAANMFNDYFHSVFLKQAEEFLIPSSPISNEIVSEIILDPSEVYHVLAHLDPHKASGPDNVSTRLLKECASGITTSLTCLFNKSLQHGILPSQWKLSNVIPLHKKGNKRFVENYRPISLMCIVAKVLERCVYNRLVNHACKMISLAQHGFLRGKSCTSQLLSVFHRISQNLDSGKQTDILYFDIAKAFDTVDHKLLLFKLSQFGLAGNILKWFDSYLSGRQQRVLVNGVISRTLPISSGVPQGSILGPLLFLIYVNDLPASISSPSVGISLFADDTKCFSIVDSLADACALKNEARNVENCALSWRLKFNPQKCKVLSVTRKYQPIVAEYTINGKIIQHVSAQKDLGVTVSSDLKWNIHIYEQVTKSNRMLGMLNRSTGKLKNVNTRRCLYLTLVRSHLAYASQVWSPQNITMCMELERIQRRATKFILRLPFRTDVSYKARLISLELLPLCYWHEFLDILFLFKCSRGIIKTNFLPQQADRLVSNVNLRSTNNSIITYNIPRIRTLCHQNSYFIRVSRVWNTLPDELRQTDMSYITFRACLYKYYYSAMLEVYNQDIIQTWKSVCIKCHKAGQLSKARQCCF